MASLVSEFCCYRKCLNESLGESNLDPWTGLGGAGADRRLIAEHDRIHWNFVFDGPERHRLRECRGNAESRRSRERGREVPGPSERQWCLRVEKTQRGETPYGVACMLSTVMSGISGLCRCLFRAGL